MKSSSYPTFLPVLIQRVRQGDEKSFELLYNEYHKDLYYFSLKFIKSNVLAEEAVHDVFLAVWQNRHSLNENLSFKSYLYAICKNHLLNVLARVSREQALKKEILYCELNYDNSTEQDIQFNEYEQLAHQAIAQLPPQRQLIFRMCRFEGKSYEDIAASLGISTGTVNDHMVKAIRYVKEYLYQHAQITLMVVFTSSYSLIILR